MKKRYLGLPAPLKKQVLIRGAFAMIALAAAASMLILGMEVFIILSLLMICGFFVFSACTILYSGYVTIAGRCTGIVKNVLRTRVKWILIDTDHGSVKVRGAAKGNFRVRDGDDVTVYLSEKARVYESDGCYTVYDYWALEKR